MLRNSALVYTLQSGIEEGSSKPWGGGGLGEKSEKSESK